MSTRPLRNSALLVTAVLVSAAAGIAAAYAIAGDALRRRPEIADGLVIGAGLLSIAAILRRFRFPGTWKSAKFLGLGILAIVAAGATFLVLDAPGTRRHLGPSPWDLLFLLGAVIFLIPIKIEFADHFPKDDRREISADVALISAALGCIAYLSIRPPSGAGIEQMSAAIFAMMAVTAFAAYGALALWVPSPAHLGQFAVIGALAASVLTFGNAWVEGTYVPGTAAVDLPLTLGPLVLAILITLIPRRAETGPSAHPARYGRPLLTTAAVAAACAALGVVANLSIHQSVPPIQATSLIALLGAAVAVRILVNQLRSIHATQETATALDQKEVALRETDKALARLQRANETLRESEERLRLVFEAAVDGIVELDSKEMIVRANEAFCQMIELPHRMVEGQPWTALAAAIEADQSFATLPTTGQGTLRREGNAFYLESRISEIPGDPPRRLLLVRDVTAARVADQTIRSLFKFLQDRDEDRTRIMRRTNAAIESERNRIARDLHDGPVQGVSAASLSLEAVLLMLKAGELAEGTEVLAKVRRELSEEADNLRRLMSGLRPPLLEERGLVPAIRETLAKFGRDADVETEFVSRSNVEVPSDLETLAYRIVQEALSNAGKHSKAGRVNVTVEGLAGQLRIEVSDDGVGFDAQQAREFLRMGRVGLASMRERVELANGTFMVHATPGKGTTVLATLPLDALPAQRELAVNEA
jgi:PAS domain S-box-containing protein